MKNTFLQKEWDLRFKILSIIHAHDSIKSKTFYKKTKKIGPLSSVIREMDWLFGKRLITRVKGENTIYFIACPRAIRKLKKLMSKQLMRKQKGERTHKIVVRTYKKPSNWREEVKRIRRKAMGFEPFQLT